MPTSIDERLEDIAAKRRRSGIDGPPERVFTLFRDSYPAPAIYVETAFEEGAPAVPVIVHNLRYYERAMRRWNTGFVELLVLNELHELTHWAMTDAERERFDEKSRRHGAPDGFWINPVLFGLIDWLPGGTREVLEPRTTLVGRLVAKAKWRLFGDRR